MKQRIIEDAKFKHAWVTREQGIELENLIAGGGSEVGKELVEQIDQVDSELQELKTNYDNHIEEFKTLKKDESELGQQVQHIQDGLNMLVRKDTKLADLCKEPCEWANDLQRQITINGQDIDKLEQLLGGKPSENQSDILFATTKQISITLTDQTLNGNFYYYDFEYDISEWDNAEYNLEGVIFKSIHKDAINGFSGDVEPSLRKKTLITISFDENKLYGTIQTPNIQDTTTGKYKLQVTCLWKKVLS